jgi:ABC-type nitrate/sulfonate/bicarbonate transport system substrate-binding protein
MRTLFDRYSAVKAGWLPVLTAAAVLVLASGMLGQGVVAQTPEPVPSGDDLEPVVLSLDWVPNTNHTGLYVALEKGWYAEEGLALEIQTPSDPAAALKQVAFGHTEFGVSFQEEVSIARAQEIPVVSIAAVIQHNTSAFSSLEGSGIVEPKDFEGKTYASYGLPLERAVLAGLMDCDGADVDSVEFIDVGFDAFPALIAGRVDFAWIFLAWDGVQAELMDKPLKHIPLSESCVPDYYTPVLIAGETTIEEKPGVVRRFVAATSKGYAYAIENPAEAAEILIKYSPETNPELIRNSQEWLSPRYQDDADQWGAQSLEVWQEFGEWMAESDLLPGLFDPESAFTNEFLPEIGVRPSATVEMTATSTVGQYGRPSMTPEACGDWSCPCRCRKHGWRR